ncbi:MAG TPA: signal peptidase I [Clostridia bacterium]|nr:signal peptidase I [Clostridia bacterium]
MAKPDTNQTEPEKPAKHKETPAEFIASISSVLVIGLFIITFCLQAFEIPSGSMERTLLIGDHVFVDRVRLAPKASWMSWLLPYRDPQRGDIVVFLSPSQPGLYVVKRIVGMPGDRLHLRDGVLYRNGERQNEPYAIQSENDYNPFRDNFPSIPPAMSQISLSPEWQLTMSQYVENGQLVVPEGAYFAMGDNREVSLDSRFWGFIPRENVVGRPMFIYWSFETPDGQYLKRDLTDRIAFIFKVIIHFFDETRWSRMLHVVR